MEKVNFMQSHSGEEECKITFMLGDTEISLLEGNQSNLVQTAWSLMGLIHSGQVSL